MTNGISLPFVVGVSPTLKIRGLIATQPIKKGQIIESCPAIVYTKDPAIIEQTIFDYYAFDWDETHEALALGYGSLHNHSDTPNVEFDLDYKNKMVVFTAIFDIAVGQELFINYDSESSEILDPGYLTFDRAMDN